MYRPLRAHARTWFAAHQNSAQLLHRRAVTDNGRLGGAPAPCALPVGLPIDVVIRPGPDYLTSVLPHEAHHVRRAETDHDCPDQGASDIAEGDPGPAALAS